MERKKVEPQPRLKAEGSSILEPQPRLKAEGSSVLDLFLFVTALVLVMLFIVFKLILPKAAEPPGITLVFDQQWENGPERETLAVLIGEFEKRNPEIQVRLYGGDTKPESQSSSGKKAVPLAPPDIIAFDEGRFSSLLKDGALASLNQYTGSETDQRAIPLVSFMDLLFYNIDILKTAGFDHPPKNRNEFLGFSKAVSNQKKYGAALALSPADSLGIRRDVFSWIWASGAALIRNGKPDFNRREIIGALDFFGQLNREGLLSPESFNKTGAQRLEEFANGQIAMMTASVRDIPYLRERMGDGAFGITVIPGPAAYSGKPVTGPSRWYAGISADCQHPDEAWAFLAFLTKKIPVLASEVRAVPESTVPGNYAEEDILYSKAWDIYGAADIIQEFSGILYGDDLEAAVRDELILFFDEKQNAAETAAAVQKRWDALYETR
ncbi:MAG: extracellular solute-binding protein [Treponema sp.]|jgi:multiple sugar transport system substrate-binding protein|nr:extracellular solute-binding protein [Treponema sp.]